MLEQKRFHQFPFVEEITIETGKVDQSVVSDSVTPWTVAYHTPPPMGLFRQEYWSGLPFLRATKPHLYRSFLLLVPEKLKTMIKNQ